MPISPALFKSSEKFEIEIDLEKVTGRHIFSNKFNYLLCNSKMNCLPNKLDVSELLGAWEQEKSWILVKLQQLI